MDAALSNSENIVAANGSGETSFPRVLIGEMVFCRMAALSIRLDFFNSHDPE
jgi:hypothetical protein